MMGGLEIDIEEDKCWIFGGRRTLSALGMILLVKLNKLPIIDAKVVAARSKADELAKTLICIEATWFLIQTVARWAQRLPVTLLELNTLAHVSCAIAMYFIWWEKPQDVNETFKVPVELPLAIFMALRHHSDIRNSFQELELP